MIVQGKRKNTENGWDEENWDGGGGGGGGGGKRADLGHGVGSNGSNVDLSDEVIPEYVRKANVTPEDIRRIHAKWYEKHQAAWSEHAFGIVAEEIHRQFKLAECIIHLSKCAFENEPLEKDSFVARRIKVWLEAIGWEVELTDTQFTIRDTMMKI